MNRFKRQAIIKRLISENMISTQKELIEQLAAEDVHTTQATISRDMQELNIVKISNGHKTFYSIDPGSSAPKNSEQATKDKLMFLIQESGVSIQQVEFINLLTTLPGHGQAVGFLIDKLRISEKHILGCVAGDDTILIVSRNKKDAELVYDYLQRFIYNTDD
ncbi:MAG: ArgR family transcriptional regulator [Aerococcus sp.]|nr:ArgR family transcriptional regulator [Aerococcus sp.]